MTSFEPDPPVHLNVELELAPTDDEVITCFVCVRERCTHQFSCRQNGRHVTVGAHEECVKSIIGCFVSEV